MDPKTCLVFLQNNHFFDDARPETLQHLCNFDNTDVRIKDKTSFSIISLDNSKALSNALLKLYF